MSLPGSASQPKHTAELLRLLETTDIVDVLHREVLLTTIEQLEKEG